MKKLNWLVLALCAALGVPMQAQQTVTIKGKVKFIDEGFKMTVYQREGTKQNVLAEAPVNADGTYEVKVPVAKPGEATLDCGKWQSVQVWLEDENLDIDFRGLDTAKVKIKNPPYVYIKGGKNNELMNLINFESYRNYQMMIAISQSVYRAGMEDAQKKQELSMKLYDASGENTHAHLRYFAEHYADRNSVMVAMREEEPVGVLQMDFRRDADIGVGGIPFFYLSPEARAHGLGVQLLGQAISTYRPLGRQFLRLRCAP